MQKKQKANQLTSKKRPGYTPQSGVATAKRNCTASGGKWAGGKCIGGVL